MSFHLPTKPHESLVTQNIVAHTCYLTLLMLGPCLLTFMCRLALFRYVFKGKKGGVEAERGLERSSKDPLKSSGDSFLGRIQDLTKGVSDKRPPKAVAPRGVRGHPSPENFLILWPLKCDFQRFQGQFEVV